MSRLKCPSPRMRRQPLHSSGVKEENSASRDFDQILEETEKVKQDATKTQNDLIESELENEPMKNTSLSHFKDNREDIEKEPNCSDNKMRLMEALKHSLLLISPERSKIDSSEVEGDSSALYRSPDHRANLDVEDKKGGGLEEKVGSSSYSNEEKDTCMETIKKEGMRNREVVQEQTGQAGSIRRVYLNIGKINKEILMEENNHKKNIVIRKRKMEDLVEKQTLDKKMLAKKHKEESSLLEKNQKHELTALKDTFAREDHNEQCDIACLKKHRNELIQDIEKLNTDAGYGASSDERSKLEPIKRFLECPICMELMRPPMKIWMCRFTHVVCQVCKDLLIAEGRNCPTCTAEPFIGRNYMAEELARNVLNGREAPDGI